MLAKRFFYVSAALFLSLVGSSIGATAAWPRLWVSLGNGSVWAAMRNGDTARASGTSTEQVWTPGPNILAQTGLSGVAEMVRVGVRPNSATAATISME